MTDILHADGPYAEITTYGVKKATAIEAVRLFLEVRELGWVSAVSDCSTRLLNGNETCLLKVVTSKNKRFHVSVKLTLQRDEDTFPISFADVRVVDYELAAEEGGGWPEQLYSITRDGMMSVSGHHS